MLPLPVVGYNVAIRHPLLLGCCTQSLPLLDDLQLSQRGSQDQSLCDRETGHCTSKTHSPIDITSYWCGGAFWSRHKKAWREKRDPSNIFLFTLNLGAMLHMMTMSILKPLSNLCGVFVQEAILQIAVQYVLITLINHKFFCLLLALVKDPCNGFEAEYCIAKGAPSTRYRLVGWAKLKEWAKFWLGLALLILFFCWTSWAIKQIVDEQAFYYKN